MSRFYEKNEEQLKVFWRGFLHGRAGVPQGETQRGARSQGRTGKGREGEERGIKVEKLARVGVVGGSARRRTVSQSCILWLPMKSSLITAAATS